MAESNLPRDQDGHPIQTLRPGASLQITLGASSARVQLPASTDVVRLSSTGTCWVAFGDETVDAATTDMLFPVGAECFGVPDGATHVAVIRDSVETGTFCVTRVS